MTDKTRVVLVGAGYVASRHLIALKDLPFVEVAGIYDVDEKRASELAARFQIPRVFTRFEDIAEVRPQVVHILTPPASHCALTMQALEMGAHVFVEKPMAETVAECDRMIAKAREKGLALSVNHSFLFEPPVRQALDLVAAGQCGDVLALHYFRGSGYPPYGGGTMTAVNRQGSYPFRDLGVHALYLLQAVMGEIKTLDVRQYSSGRDPLITFDEWRLFAECEKGTGHIMLSWNMLPLQNEIWIQGTRGILHVNVFTQQCLLQRTYPGPKQLHAMVNGIRNSLASLVQIPSFLIRGATGRIKPSPGIYESVIAFHKALHEGRPMPVSPEEGRSTIEWVEAAAKQADIQKDRAEVLREQHLPGPARILVTGANGFLGSALIKKLLEKGERPRVFLRRPAPAGSVLAGLDAVYGDLGEPGAVDRAVAGVEVVYHVGAAMKGGPIEFEAGTIWGTRNIVDACVKHHVKRLVYVSSAGVLDVAGHPDGVPVNEASPLEPHPELRGIYTGTKMQAERIVLDAIRDRGLSAVILRPGQIFGTGAEQVSPNGVIKIAGQWIVAGNGNRQLPLVYVDDVADGLIAAETAPNAPGQIVHLIDSTPVTQNQYLQWCKPALGKTPVRKMPVGILMGLGWMCDQLVKVVKRPLPLSTYRVRSLKPLAPIDSSGAQKILGWTPKVGVTEGLDRTFRKFRT